MIAFRKITSTDRQIMRIQDNVADVFKSIALGLISDGVLIETITIGVVATVVNHTLGRLPLGWLVISKYGLGDVYEISRNNSTLSLISSVSVRCGLWIF